MASLIEDLLDVLDNENKKYTKLLDLSMQKTAVIVKGDVDELQSIVAKEQLIVDDINILEKRRQEGLGDISNVLNIPYEELTLGQLIIVMEKQPKEHAALIKVHDELKATVDKMVKINDNNKMLLQQSLDMVEFELNLARNAMMAPETANYSKDAFNTSTRNPQMGSFDAKQ